MQTPKNQRYQGKNDLFYHLTSFYDFYKIFASAYKMRTRYAKKVVTTMKTLGKLEKLLLAGEITVEEYKKRKEVYIEQILELYILGIITKEQMQEKLND